MFMYWQDSYQHQPLLDDISSDDEAGANSSGYTRRKSRHPREGPIPSNNGKLSSDVCIAIEEQEEETFVDSRPSADFIPKEPLKTLLAFIFLFFAWVATTTSLALAHERVPEMAPLPDVVLDNVHYQSWGLDTSEIIIMIATFAAFTLALFHQHR